MQPTLPIGILLSRLWKHINRRRRVQLCLLLILMILASFAEIISIGIVLPFLAILTNPDSIFSYPNAKPILLSFGLTSPDQLLLPLTVAFALAAVVAGTIRLILMWASNHLSYSIGADLSSSVYRRTLYQPYSVQVTRNTSEIVDAITTKTNSSIFLMNMTLNLISSSVLLVAILLVLVSVDPVIALSSFCVFGLIYAFIIQMTRKRLLINSQIVASESINVIRSLQEGLGGIRDVLIDGSQETYCQIHRDADQLLRKAQGNNSFIASSPRYAVEAIGMVLIAGLAYTLVNQSFGNATAIPVLGLMTLGAQRLMPVLQQVYGSWANIRSSQASLQETLSLLEQPLPDSAHQFPAEPLLFQEQISLKRLSFSYSQQTPCVLQEINLNIPKGGRVGFIGITGSGKSTLLDIVMGLLQPTTGSVEVDGQLITDANNRSWQAHIAHVPQSIYLSDNTIEENIAFGVPKSLIDLNRVKKVSHQAQLSEIIESWPAQYQTLVGERGMRLSGGQRQRIGIARALYKRADVIIFDEATSALDNETEHAVMQAIEELSKDLTLLIIAHRLTTLKNCTQIFELSEGRLVRSGTYKDIVG